MKFTPRARASVFLGYPLRYKGYKQLDLESQKLYITRNVVFHDNIFPFAQSRLNSEHLNLFVDHVIPRPIESISMLHSHQNLSTSSSPKPIDGNQYQALQPTSRPLRIIKCPTFYPITIVIKLQIFFFNLFGLSSLYLLYPISSFLCYHRLSKSCRTFTLEIITQIKPQTFLQAVESQVWRDSMDIELQALESNDTWSLVTLSSGEHLLNVNGCIK